MKSLASAVAALALLAGCNKPSPAPEASVPPAESTDTVATAGAPIADSLATNTDSVADSTTN
jgi:hypothetical protein